MCRLRKQIDIKYGASSNWVASRRFVYVYYVVYTCALSRPSRKLDALLRPFASVVLLLELFGQGSCRVLSIVRTGIRKKKMDEKIGKDIEQFPVWRHSWDQLKVKFRFSGNN